MPIFSQIVLQVVSLKKIAVFTSAFFFLGDAFDRLWLLFSVVALL